MGKRFVPVRDADRRAIDLHFMLKEVAELPLIEVQVLRDKNEKQPIYLVDKTNPQFWRTLSIDLFLSLNVEQAKAEGGTASALLYSRKKPERPRLPQTEVDRAVNKFLIGEDDE